MSSRKKLTISLFAVAAIVVVAIVALVNVLAATKQTITSSFKVYYKASSNVVADVSGLYNFTSVQGDTFDPTSITGTPSSAEITSSTVNPTELLTIPDRVNFNKDNVNEQALIFKFTIENKSSQGFRASLSVGNEDGSDTYTDVTFAALNLQATYWDGDSWESIFGQHFDIAGTEYNATPVVNTFYIQITVLNMDYDVNSGNELGMQLLWDLDATTYGA